MNIAVILASGVGSRMKAGKNKIFLKIKNKPLLAYAIDSFENSHVIDRILLVARKEDFSEIDSIIKFYRLDKIIGAIEGGNQRQDSSYNAVKFLADKYSSKNDVRIIFHNAANPFVTEDEITSVIKNSKLYGASVVAHKTKDTIREVDDNGFSKKLLDRSRLWSMQTPQCIELEIAVKSFEKAKRDGFIGTDDVSLVEYIGGKVKIVEASEYNFKITTPIDLKLAEVIINNKLWI